LERIKAQVLEELNVKDLKIDGLIEVARLEEHGYVVSGLEHRLDKQKGIAEFTKGAYLIAIPTEISPELLAEGLAREIVHRLQTMRRAAGFDIADHIITYYQGDDYIRQVIKDFASYIKQETLSRELSGGVPTEGAFTESYKLSGHEILLGVRRLD
jgi:isoleucyl-tRNA synthetase